MATLIFAENCRWQEWAGQLLEGERLPRGRLRSKKVWPYCDSMAVRRRSLPVRPNWSWPRRAAAGLLQGRLTVKVPEEAIGFTVQTPSGDVVDLGTEFAVDVGKKGATELYVLDGTVEHGQPSDRPGTGQVFRGGQSVRYESGDSQKYPPCYDAGGTVQ